MQDPEFRAAVEALEPEYQRIRAQAWSNGEPRFWQKGYLNRDYHRALLDREMFRIAADLRGQRVVDLGGERVSRRGRFVTPADWTCVNIDPATGAEIIADVSNTHLPDASFDAVVCTATLEHIDWPERVIAEAARLLRPGGRLFIAMPFLFPLHGDPRDYQRWTPDKFRLVLGEWFSGVEIRPVGYFWSVLGDMLRWQIAVMRPRLLRYVVALLVMPWLDRRVRREMQPGAVMSERRRRYVPGHWLEAMKR